MTSLIFSHCQTHSLSVIFQTGHALSLFRSHINVHTRTHPHTHSHILAHTLSFIELCEIALGHLSRWPGYGSQPCLNCNLKQMTFTANHCDSELNKNQNGVRIWSFSPLSSLTHVHALSLLHTLFLSVFLCLPQSWFEHPLSDLLHDSQFLLLSLSLSLTLIHLHANTLSLCLSLSLTHTQIFFIRLRFSV